jgi:hypothetical protein
MERRLVALETALDPAVVVRVIAPDVAADPGRAAAFAAVTARGVAPRSRVVLINTGVQRAEGCTL